MKNYEAGDEFVEAVGETNEFMKASQSELSQVKAELESARLAHKKELELKQAEFDKLAQYVQVSGYDMERVVQPEAENPGSWATFCEAEERTRQNELVKLRETIKENLKTSKDLEAKLASKIKDLEAKLASMKAQPTQEPSKEMTDLVKEKNRPTHEINTMRKTDKTTKAALLENKTLKEKVLSDSTNLTTVTKENDLLKQQLSTKTKSRKGLESKVNDLSQAADLYNERAERQIKIDRDHNKALSKVQEELGLERAGRKSDLVESKKALSNIRIELGAEKAGRRSDLALCRGPYTELAKSKSDIGILVDIGYKVRGRNWE